MILKAENLSFSYGETQILNNVSFNAEKASISCLMGPNGSGKTTLLDCLMGNHKVQGKIELLGKDLISYKKNEIAKHISYIPQLHTPAFPYSVRDFVLLGRIAYASVFGEPKASDEIACDEAIRKLGLNKYKDKPYSALSGGELRLALLARALCQETEIILMDEPCAYLDFKNEMLFLERISKLVEEEGVTVIMATHSPNHAFYFEENNKSVNAALLSAGELICCGKPSEIITKESIAEVFGVEAEIADIKGIKNMVIKKAL